GAGEHAGLRVAEVRGQPRRAARPRGGVPGAAAVLGGEQAGRVAVAAVAGDDAGAVVEEADAVQAGQLRAGQPGPLQAAVVGEQDDPGTAAAVGQLLAADGPAGVRVEEEDGAQRRAGAGGLALPVLAAVDGVPDAAVGAG